MGKEANGVEKNYRWKIDITILIGLIVYPQPKPNPITNLIGLLDSNKKKIAGESFHGRYLPTKSGLYYGIFWIIGSCLKKGW